MTSRIRQYFQNESGVAAIEFAWLFPIMVTLLFGGYEVSRLLEVQRKSTNVVASVADLVSQATVVTDDNMQDVFNASAAIMHPFTNANLTIVVTSIKNDAGVLEVVWSEQYHGQERTTVPSDFPADIVPDGSSVIYAETTYVYDSGVSDYFGAGGLSISDEFYARPRRAVEVLRVP